MDRGTDHCKSLVYSPEWELRMIWVAYVILIVVIWLFVIAALRSDNK